MLEGSLHFHLVRPHDRLAVAHQFFGTAFGEFIPGFELARVGGDRGIDFFGTHELPIPQVLVLDVFEQGRRGVVGMKIVPSEYRTRVVEIEVDFVARSFELIHGRGIGLVAELGRDVVVEQDDVARNFREFSQLLVVDRNVDEDHQSVFEFIEWERVVMGSPDVARVVTPCAPHRPDRSKSIRTTGVIKANSLHQARIPDRSLSARNRHVRSDGTK